MCVCVCVEAVWSKNSLVKNLLCACCQKISMPSVVVLCPSVIHCLLNPLQSFEGFFLSFFRLIGIAFLANLGGINKGSVLQHLWWEEKIQQTQRKQHRGYRYNLMKITARKFPSPALMRFGWEGRITLLLECHDKHWPGFELRLFSLEEGKQHD